jgi:hypothetical protein
MAKRSEELQVEDNMIFQRTEWRVQRIGWVLWALAIVAALLGLVGPGPLSSQETSAEDGSVTLKFDRFVHYHHPTQLELVMRPEVDGPENLRVEVAQTFLDRVEIHRIEPEPMGRQLSDDGVVFTFPVADGSESNKIVFHMEYEKYGHCSGRIGLLGRQAVDFKQFVYP